MPPAVTDTEKARASSRYVRVAPNKARQVVAHIRGLEVEEARRLLQLSPKGVAEQILKTLDSAVANAEHNVNPPFDADELVVTSAVVDEGPMLKRFQPRAMGRAYRVRKRTSHITVAVGLPPESRPRGRGRSRAAAAARAGAAATPTRGATALSGREGQE
jgi:large subunit ribosomal protein L22